ncbi:MAG TPA: protein adenylyltransferase SelO family protein, partial [Cellvibrio sp.]|nr:protein adenylyltransferase SelO family protein [Cellvibrio sp.]
MSKLLADLRFDNRFVRALPGDPIVDNYRRQVANACYSFANPTIVRAPQLVCAATDVADLINLDHSELSTDFFSDIFSGNKFVSGMQPYACCYGGHQFGNWAGQLGDGRAINLGEVKTAQGEYWTLQLKGAGPTPYSRTADGLAVLRSSVREFLCSEAMHHLGVPTTRALSLILTGEQVRRDMFYDGNPQLEPGAVVCRVAPSFTRFGNFEISSARNDVDLLKKLTDFTIRTDFPHLVKNEVEITREIYVKWFDEICARTADMIAHWMRVGFVHGVMNTDNMSIIGLTIDYGPYGWLEGYDPDWTPNTT